VVFKRIDTNNDGTIEAAELMALYREHFGEENEEEVGNILSKIDQNESGKIDFNEFIVAMYTRKRLFLEDALTDAFSHYDVNHDGFLQRGELIALLEGCEREEIEFLLQELDVDGDDRVSLEEFLNYMRKFS
jgi:Ca2+-binding EF-hand superfamily protein